MRKQHEHVAVVEQEDPIVHDRHRRRTIPLQTSRPSPSHRECAVAQYTFETIRAGFRVGDGQRESEDAETEEDGDLHQAAAGGAAAEAPKEQEKEQEEREQSEGDMVRLSVSVFALGRAGSADFAARARLRSVRLVFSSPLRPFHDLSMSLSRFPSALHLCTPSTTCCVVLSHVHAAEP